MHTSPIDAMQLWINPATMHPWNHIYIQKAVQLGPRSTALPLLGRMHKYTYM